MSAIQQRQLTWVKIGVVVAIIGVAVAIFFGTVTLLFSSSENTPRNDRISSNELKETILPSLSTPQNIFPDEPTEKQHKGPFISVDKERTIPVTKTKRETREPISPSPPMPESVQLSNRESVRLADSNSFMSVNFLQVMGKKFAKLTITPLGKKSVTRPIYNSGQSIEFTSSTGFHMATVLQVDLNRQEIEVIVSKLIQ